MINPCAVKGISHLPRAGRAPARRVQFGVVPGWGTTAEDRRALERLPNVRFLPNARNIDDVLARTRVLLMPSLWYEGFGLIVMESMLRGIPVVASDSGGLIEAKRGTGYVIPVRTDRAVPGGVRRARHAAPGGPRERPGAVGGSRGGSARGPRRLRARIGGFARARPDRFVGSLDAARSGALPGGARRRATTAHPPAARTIESLSPEKRALLLQRLHQRQDRALMRILLAQNSLYYPAHGGGDKSNRLLLEALAARGHECRVVARISVFGEAEHQRLSRPTGGARRGTPVGVRTAWWPSRATAWTSRVVTQRQSARLSLRRGGSVPPGRHPGLHRRPGAASARSRAALGSAQSSTWRAPRWPFPSAPTAPSPAKPRPPAPRRATGSSASASTSPITSAATPASTPCTCPSP